MELSLGFSTGCFYKSNLTLSQKLEAIRLTRCKAVELGFIRSSDLDDAVKTLLRKELNNFDYMSMHAPVHTYGRNKSSMQIFRNILYINMLRRLDLVVFHPDAVGDFGVFTELAEANIPIAFENMDNRKKTHKTVADMNDMFQKNDYARMVLDVQHAYANDPSGKLTSDFWSDLHPRIDQIHLSGFRDNYHAPLYQTRQAEIIESIENFNKPIIIESPLPCGIKSIVEELEYVTSKIGQE